MLMLKTLPAAKGSRNMKARLEPFSRSLWKKKGKFEFRLHRNLRGLMAMGGHRDNVSGGYGRRETGQHLCTVEKEDFFLHGNV